MKKIAFLPLAILLASAVFLACGGDDDDGGGQTILGGGVFPVTTEINGLLTLSTKDVKAGTVTSLDTGISGWDVKITAVDHPEADALAETSVNNDRTYSLVYTSYPGTPVFVFIEWNNQQWVRLGSVVLNGGNLRSDFELERKLIHVKGNVNITENPGGSKARNGTIELYDTEDPYAGNVVSSASFDGVSAPVDYDIIIDQPTAETTYYAFYSSQAGIPVSLGSVTVAAEAEEKTAQNFTKTVDYTPISGAITYKLNGTDTPYADMFYISASGTPTDGDIIGFGNGHGLGIPTSYTAMVIKQASQVTGYIVSQDSSGEYELLTETTITIPASTNPLTGKDFTITAGTTTISGNVKVTQDGTALNLANSNMVVVYDGDNNWLGYDIINGTTPNDNTYSVIIPRPKASTTVYLSVLGYTKEVSVGSSDVTKTQHIEFSRKTTPVKGYIGGPAGRDLANVAFLVLTTVPNLTDTNDLAPGQNLGSFTLTASSNGAQYDGRITRPESATHVYYYVSKSGYNTLYYIGEGDIDADQTEIETKDFILSLASKNIILGL
jgi:hypothetical protein